MFYFRNKITNVVWARVSYDKQEHRSCYLCALERLQEEFCNFTTYLGLIQSYASTRTCKLPSLYTLYEHLWTHVHSAISVHAVSPTVNLLLKWRLMLINLMYLLLLNVVTDCTRFHPQRQKLNQRVYSIR